jgi:hypothetical protein
MKWIISIKKNKEVSIFAFIISNKWKIKAIIENENKKSSLKFFEFAILSISLRRFLAYY